MFLFKDCFKPITPKQFIMETPLTPLEFARRTRKLHPDRLAVVDGDLRFTYSQFIDRCNRWSFALQRLGIKPGDRIAYIAPNSHAQLESFYSVPQIGAVLVPINYRLSTSEFKYIINHSGARMVCAHSDYINAVESIHDELPSVEFLVALEGEKKNWLHYEELLKSASGSFVPYDLNELDLITINYTSGTTSRPKGVMITHRNAYLSAVGMLIHCHLSIDEKYLWTLPMFHANGWTFVWAITGCGGTHICLRKVNPENIFELINKENASLFCAAPTVLIGIVNANESLRKNTRRGIRLLTGGAPPAAATIHKIEYELGWKLQHVYGLTETSPLITFCEERPEHSLMTPNELAATKAKQGVEFVTTGEVKVVHEDDIEVPWDGQTMGEIVSRGNVVMKGYYNDPEATGKVIRNGWFHTGDAAVVHPDGYVEIKDRIKDVIISGGENISSVELEGVLLRHKAVQEVAVVGMPHEKWGESPHAFVVLRTGESATEEELRNFVGEHLASFKKPQWISFVNELPKTATGKIQKFVLRGNRTAISRQ
jgi:fatty-acyl-CoA synthase